MWLVGPHRETNTDPDSICQTVSCSGDEFPVEASHGASAFSTLSTVTTTPGCLLAPRKAITHGTAFAATETAARGMLGTCAVSRRCALRDSEARWHVVKPRVAAPHANQPCALSSLPVEVTVDQAHHPVPCRQPGWH